MENNDVNSSQWLNERLSKLQSDAEWQPNVLHGLKQFQEGRRLRRIRARRKIGVAIGLATIVLAGLAFPVTRGLADRYVSACVSLLRGLSGPATSPAYTNADYRKPAPSFTLTDNAGQSVTLAGLRGKVVLLAFWTPNCATCDIEMSWFREFEQQYGRDRLIFLNHRISPGMDSVVDLFGSLDAIPTTLLIDKSGRIAVTHGGFCSREEFDTGIRALLNES
jgi:thiol-disulfide isomerase/thioredoxin